MGHRRSRAPRSIIPRLEPFLSLSLSHFSTAKPWFSLFFTVSPLLLLALRISEGGDKESLSKEENEAVNGSGQCRGVRPQDTVDCPREKTTEELNGKEWSPNEAKLVDLWLPVRGNEGDEVVVKTFLPLKNRVVLRSSSFRCDNIFLRAYENSIRSFGSLGFDPSDLVFRFRILS